MATSPDNSLRIPSLTGSRDIRLVQFAHCDDTLDWIDLGSISMTIITTSLESCPPYRALSYAWGSAEVLQTITLEGQQLAIRKNLFDFLQMFYYSADAVGYLWIDQLCIDQDNDIERSCQVQMMGEIFSKAQEVIAWIGTTADSSDEMMKRIGDIERRATTSEAQVDNIWRSSLSDGSDVSSGVFDFIFLMQRPYWSRLWIIQELALAKHVQIYCGTAQCSGSAFENVLRCLQLGTSVQSSFPLSLNERPTELGLAEVIGRFCEAKCKDVRDKIFGLAALVKEIERPRVDYSASPEKVFADVCARLLDIHAQRSDRSKTHDCDQSHENWTEAALNKLASECEVKVNKDLGKLIKSIHWKVTKGFSLSSDLIKLANWQHDQTQPTASLEKKTAL